MKLALFIARYISPSVEVWTKCILQCVLKFMDMEKSEKNQPQIEKVYIFFFFSKKIISKNKFFWRGILLQKPLMTGFKMWTFGKSKLLHQLKKTFKRPENHLYQLLRHPHLEFAANGILTSKIWWLLNRWLWAPKEFMITNMAIQTNNKLNFNTQVTTVLKISSVWTYSCF